MTRLTETERLVAVETKLEILIEKVDGLVSKVDTFATKSEVADLKKRHTLQVWLTGTLSAIFGVIMTILVQNYLGQ